MLRPDDYTEFTVLSKEFKGTVRKITPELEAFIDGIKDISIGTVPADAPKREDKDGKHSS